MRVNMVLSRLQFLRKELSSSVFIMLMRVAAVIIQAVMLVFLANAMDQHDLGFFAVALAVSTIARFLGPLGFDQLAMRGSLKADQSNAGIVDAIVLVILAGTVASFALMTIGIFRQFLVLDTPYVALAVLIIPIQAYCGLMAGYVRGKGKVLLSQAPESLGFYITMILSFIITAHFMTLDIDVAIYILLLSSIVVAVLLTAFSLEHIRSDFSDIDLRRLRFHTHEASNIFIALFLTSFSGRAPILLSLPLLGPAGAALTEIAFKFGTLGTIISTSVGNSFAPQFAKASSNKDYASTARLLVIGSSVSGAAALMVALGLALFFPLAGSAVLPSAYSGAYLPLLVFAVAVAVNAGFGLASTHLFMSGKAETVSKMSLIQIIAVYVFSIPLALTFGALGLAIAYLVGALLRDGLLFCIVWRQTHR